MFIAMLFTRQRWKQPKCPSIGGLMNNVAYNRILFSLKMERILTYAIVWINLGETMISEISQAQKDKYCSIVLI